MTRKAVAGHELYRSTVRWSEACLSCKKFYNWKASCDTCSYRIKELEELQKVNEAVGNFD